jgi:hypothetical protein
MELLALGAKKMSTEQRSIWDKLRLVLKEVMPFTTTYRDYFIVYMDLGLDRLNLQIFFAQFLDHA